MGKDITTLNEIELSHKCEIIKIFDDCKIRSRLRDLGLSDGKIVRAVLRARGIAAYEIGGALIAIRDSDSRKICVREVADIDG